ncbi:MAG: alpha/beta hydrolase [Candidatus Saccharibacteria bacterium]
MQVITNKLLTEYSKTGSGKTIMFLHGWGDSSRSFADLQKHLAKQFCVISLDLPGFGASQPPDKAWKLEDYALFVQTFLEKINSKPVYAIVAHSNGGALAIYGLAQKQLAAKKLILIGAAGIRDQQKTKRLLLKIIAKTGKTATFWLPIEKKQQLRKRLYGVVGSDMLLVPHMQETFKQTVRQDVQAEAAKLKLPTLLLYGENDKATPPLYGEIYNQLIQGSRLKILASAGHFVHHDQQAQCLALIQDFLVS